MFQTPSPKFSSFFLLFYLWTFQFLPLLLGQEFSLVLTLDYFWSPSKRTMVLTKPESLFFLTAVSPKIKQTNKTKKNCKLLLDKFTPKESFSLTTPCLLNVSQGGWSVRCWSTAATHKPSWGGGETNQKVIRKQPVRMPTKQKHTHTKKNEKKTDNHQPSSQSRFLSLTNVL